ncbi:MAG: hypothetical protein ACE5JE_07310 [Thermoplasmata archaeon]
MMEEYARAVVMERTQPRNLAELRNYLRGEYGLGTEPGFLLPGAAAETPRLRDRVGRVLRQVVGVLSRAARTQAASRGRRSLSGSPEHTR